MANVEGIESKHWTYMQGPNGETLYTLTGVARTTVHTDSDDYFRDTLSIHVDIPDLPPGKGLDVQQYAPFATLNSIANDGPDANAAWAVDTFDVHLDPAPHPPSSARAYVSLQCNLAVRGRGSYLLRVAYMVSLGGVLLDLD